MRALRPDSDSRIPPRGNAVASATGHWGELIQGRVGPDGPVALVTLSCPLSRAEAWFDPAPGAPLIVSGPLGGKIAARAARLALGRLGCAGLGGRLRIAGDAPPSAGAGSSTLAALTAIRSVASACGARFSADIEAALCLAAEGASDPIMHERPMQRLWASRLGRTLAMLPPPPPMLAVGALDGPGAPTDPSDQRFAEIDDLLALYRAGAEAGDLSRVAAAATGSADRLQAIRPRPRWSELKALAERFGAEGVALAHTGSAFALLFQPARRREAEGAALALAATGFEKISRFDPAARPAAARG